MQLIQFNKNTFYGYKWIFPIVFLAFVSSFKLKAQLLDYPEIYPTLSFDLKKATTIGYNKCTVWKGVYSKTSGDEDGQIWSSTKLESHQFQKYTFPEGIMDIISNYLPNGDKKWSMEFFYKQGFLSAIECLSYDSMQNSSFDYAYAYLYKHDSVPFQKVKMFGFPNKNLRQLDEFEFNKQGQLVRTKSTISGKGPHMDSLVGLKTGEQLLSLYERDSQFIAHRVYKNLYVILQDEKSFIDSSGCFYRTEYRDAEGVLRGFANNEYEGAKLVRKTHWELPFLEPEVPEVLPKKRKKRKKTEVVVDTVAQNPAIPQPFISKKEYFTYNEEGLIEMHIIEEKGMQTVLEYTFFME